MCSIDKLLIKGVRSFSPNNQHVIEFYRPLTLIVGQNGAGKTVRIGNCGTLGLHTWKRAFRGDAIGSMPMIIPEKWMPPLCFADRHRVP